MNLVHHYLEQRRCIRLPLAPMLEQIAGPAIMAVSAALLLSVWTNVAWARPAQAPAPSVALLDVSELPSGWRQATANLAGGLATCPVPPGPEPVATATRSFLAEHGQLQDMLIHQIAVFAPGEAEAALDGFRSTFDACVAGSGPTGDSGPSGSPIVRLTEPYALGALGDDASAWHVHETGDFTSFDAVVVVIRAGDALAVLNYRVDRFVDPAIDPDFIAAAAQVAADRLLLIATP